MIKIKARDLPTHSLPAKSTSCNFVLIVIFDSVNVTPPLPVAPGAGEGALSCDERGDEAEGIDERDFRDTFGDLE